MGKFKFRLRFHLQDGLSINIDEECLVLFMRDDGTGLTLKGANGSAIKNSSRLVIAGEPYGSHEDAMRDAVLVRNNLLSWAARRRVGLDVGEGILRYGFTERGLTELQKKLGKPARNDVHGIDVWEVPEGGGTVSFVDQESSCRITIDREHFLASIREVVGGSASLVDEELVAARLYALSCFESSPRTRFLTLMAALESLLVNRDAHSAAVQAFISDTQERLKELANDMSAAASLRGALKELKKESIGQAGKKLAAKFLGDKRYLDLTPEKFFARIYTVRSEIVHAGQPSDPAEDLLLLANVTSGFLADILWEMMDRRGGPVTTIGRPVTVIEAVQATSLDGPLEPAPYRTPIRPPK